MSDLSIGDLPRSLDSSSLVDADVFVLDDDSASDETKRITAGELAQADQFVDLYANVSGEADVNLVAASGSTETLTLAPVHRVTMDQNCTFTFPSPSADGHSFSLRLAGSYTPTFPGSVEWLGGSAPTYSSPTTYVFVTTNGGTDWLGVVPDDA